MDTSQLPASSVPYTAPGLPTLYGQKGGWCVWASALPLPHTAQLRGPGTLAPARGYADADRIAEEGEVIVYFENDDGSDVAPDPIMLDTARWLLENDAAFFQAVLAAMLADLPGLREIEDSIVLGDDAFRLPEQWDQTTLLSLIRLNNINVHPVAGAPYIGLDLRCAWEPEHGYGLMMAGTEVVETGGADVGSLSWIAARHAGGDTE